MARETLNFNKPQQRIVVQQPSEATSVWPRGTGKSFIIAWIMHCAVRMMPRSAWALAGESYKQILTRTLPGTVAALGKLGYAYERDFYIRKKPPASAKFKRPYEAPLSYDNFLIFRNGTGFHLASLDPGGGSVRGLNTDGIISDESLLISGKKKEKFTSEILATNRGNGRYFQHVPFHHGVFHFSSMPTSKESSWLLESSEYYQDSKYYRDLGRGFREIRNEIIELQLKFVQNKNTEYRLRLWEQIAALKKQLRFFKSEEGILYSEADIFDNIHNVGIKFIEQQYRDLTDFMFLTEILNKFFDTIEGGFYAHLDRYTHGYRDSFDNGYLSDQEYGSENLRSLDSRMDGDVLRTQPLRIAVDWGSKINCLTVTQHLKSLNELRFLKNMYVKRPKLLDHLAADFCEYYRYHGDKTVFFAYDHTGNSQMANSDLTYAEQFAKILRKNGWSVRMAPKFAPPTHQEKYLLVNRILREHDPSYPKLRFNLENCKETVVSMEQAPARDVPGKGITKDKSSERSSMPQEEATHLSDTVDIHVVSLFADFLEEAPGFVDIMS